MFSLSHSIKTILGNCSSQIFVKQLNGRTWSLLDMSKDVTNLIDKLRGQNLALTGKVVGIAMRSSYEWIIADFAALVSDAIALPVPLDFSDEQIFSLLEHTDYCLIQDEKIGERLKTILSQQTLVLPNGNLYYKGKKVTEKNHNIDSSVIKIIHTSGTTSRPKGVKIKDEAVRILVKNLLCSVGEPRPLHYLSLVPMSLLIEQVLGIYMPLFSGGTVTLMPEEMREFGGQSDNVENYLALIKKSEPNFIYLPPKLLEASIKKIGESSVTTLFGNTIPHIITGGAKVNIEILKQFADNNIKIYEAYGLSENSSVISINSPAQYKLGTVGKLLPGIEAKFEEGELLIKSPTLCAGYFTKDSTACDFTEDGFLKTGDIAHFDEENFLCITGRKKHLIILSNARNISPEWVESIFKESRYIDEIIVFGDGMDTLAAVIVPVSTNEAVSNEVFNKVPAEIDRLNLKLPTFARIESYVVIENSGSFKQNYFTVTGRPKRSEIFRDFSLCLYN